MYTKESFVVAANITHNKKYNYINVDYKSASEKVEIICKLHGSFWQTPSHHMHGRGCGKCGHAIAGSKIKSNNKQFIIKAKTIHGELYSYELLEYINAITKVKIICKTHGVFEQTPHDHLDGHGCWECFLLERRSNYKNVIERANIIHCNKYKYNGEYVNSRTKISITCPYHGRFLQTPDNHLHGSGCPKCLKVYKQNKWLDTIGIPDDKYHREVMIFVGNKRFKVDGYDPDTKTVYEFNGDSWHGNPKIFNAKEINRVTKTTYGYLYEKTIQRECTLRTAGYNICSIWESDFDL